MEERQKYKQTIIPEVSTDGWKGLSLIEIRNKTFAYYCSHYLNSEKRVKNKDTGIIVEFEKQGARKVAHGGYVYPEKMCLVQILEEMIRHAKYSNWGERKEKDPPKVLGYLNFNAKVKIDGKIEYVHLIIRVSSNGKFHYSMEVNILENKKTVRFTVADV